MVLDQLVNDIRQEECLWSMKAPESSANQQEAWRRVANKNKLSAVEVKLIFRELTKKYIEERKKKPKSTWKLFDQLRFLDENEEPQTERKKIDSPPQIPAAAQQVSDEDMYVELLEVNEEEFSDEESSSKENSFQENKEMEPETVRKNGENERKIIRPVRPVQTSNISTAAKTTPTTLPSIKRKPINNDAETKTPPEKLSKNSETIMRKQFPMSRISYNPSNGVVQALPKTDTHANQTENINGKENEAIETNGNISEEGAKSLPIDINSIKVEKSDEIQTFKDEMIRDEIELQRSKLTNQRDDNDENTPTISPHSRAHNSFGQYVSSTLNALPEKLASKLEIKILEAIIAVNSEKMF